MNGSTLLLLPVMAQIFLTFSLVAWLGYAKVQALKTKQVRLEEVAIRPDGWPDNVTKIGNNFNNQFQLPVLFYILSILILIRGEASMVYVILGWMFFGFRLLHSFIHTGKNIVSQRFYAYLGSLLTVLVMWCLFMFDIWFSL